ncbi:MAG TPA: antitoxin [Streptosporangiaceae bacterium]|nr:antitoxin [Streptosporangiaceae bacterium]
MSEFMDDAKKLASEHQDVADEGLDKAGQFADEKTGGKYDSQIEGAENKAEDYLGVQDQDAKDKNQ